MRSLYTARGFSSAAQQHIVSRDNHVPSVPGVGEQSESRKSTATQLESTHALLSVDGSKGAVLEVYVWYCRESVDCVA